MASLNLAAKYADKVDERFFKESQVASMLNNDYDFTGEKVVRVYSIPISGMNDYTRSGSARYGTAVDLGRNIQTMTINVDRSFTYVIDKGDKIQSQMVSDAGKSLSRQLREVCVPEYDEYIFNKMAGWATANGACDVSTSVSASNAFSQFLKGVAYLGNHNVPDEGRICYCSYAYANFLMQDSNFIKASDSAQNLMLKGYVGSCFGVPIVLVAGNRLPKGAAFILAYTGSIVAPKQLEEYKIHEDPVGISGWLVEGRMIYDAFLLDSHKDCIWYCGGQTGLVDLPVSLSPNGTNKVAVVVNRLPEAAGNKRYIDCASTQAGLPSVTEGSAITTSDWTEITSSNFTHTYTSGDLFARIVEVDGSSKPVAVVTVALPAVVTP